MKMHILSDVHNEFLRGSTQATSHTWRGEIPRTDADVIVLAGDIDTGLHGAEWMIGEAARLAKPVVYVLGNHEFYGHEYYALKQAIAAKLEGSAVHLLDCGCFECDGVRILGATLWTDYGLDPHIPRDLAMYYAEQQLADHKTIRYKSTDSVHRFRPLHAMALHKREKHCLNAQLSAPYPGRTVVVTHHAPHPLCSHPGFPNSPLGPAFGSNLEDMLVNHDIDLWVYGHTHANFDRVVQGTRILTNQAGYPGEGVAGFDAGLVVEI